MNYQDFLASKAVRAQARGLESVPQLGAHMGGFRGACAEFALRAGSSGCFLGTGLGKTSIETEFAYHAAEASNGWALIMTPLAVARQIEAEAIRWGYDSVRVIRDQSEARAGLNICNYDRLDKLEPDAFGAVVADESSILKAFGGKTSRALIAAFAGHRWRLAATATPAPNDHMELGQQCEFLGLMAQVDMLVRWFINDSADTGQWRLKGHAVRDFWDWVASWARMADHPRDLGYDVDGFDLPALKIIRHRAETAPVAAPGSLFAGEVVSATTLHDVKRQTIGERARVAAAVVEADPDESWLIWCDTDYEADALIKAIPGAVEVRGSHPIDRKEETLAAFLSGEKRRLITKPSIAGWGLNVQMCARMLFVGRSFSFEAWHQAVRRCWRFGQLREVECHLIVADGEDAIGRVIDRKTEDHERMRLEMAAAMKRSIGRTSAVRVAYNPTHAAVSPRWIGEPVKIECLGESHGRNYSAYHGDCVGVVAQLPTASVGLSVFSPPFSNLFVYSDSEADMGNSANDAEFLSHYRYLLRELVRVTKPGRLAAVHCSDLPLTKRKDGVIGIKDLSGDIIRAHQAEGWVLHSRITIWKSPVVEMTRTKALGLLYKQLQKDSTRSRQGMADYLLVFRAPGENVEPVEQRPADFPLDQWQQWASPVWMDINQTDTLNAAVARSDKDERHVCPLQLDLIRRALIMWSRPGETVLSPFMGIGSEGLAALRAGRKFVGVELKAEYFKVASEFLESEDRQESLFAQEIPAAE